LLRGRVNDAIKSMLLAYAVGADLDQIAANVNAARLSGETDARFRPRVQTAMWAYTATGNPAAYKWHAMSASPDVVDAAVSSPSSGRVDVIVLAPKWVDPIGVPAADFGIGQALFPDLAAPASWTDDNPPVPILADQSSDIHALVRTELQAEDVAPLTDELAVLAPAPIEVTITAELSLYPGPDSDTVLADALEALDVYLLAIRHPGYDCTRAGIIDALVVSGVRAIDLSSPAADVVCTPYQIAAATEIVVTVADARDV
jgi:phage-related baseplate assembly protein